MVEHFFRRGWARFEVDSEILRWVQSAKPAALRAVAAPENVQWHQCQGTWFVGVDALPNDARGGVTRDVPLAGAALEFIAQQIGALPPLHPAQVSVTYPGYPKPRQGETEAGFRYRLNRDAAHVDGVLPIGPDRRRMLKEPHMFILGLPLTDASSDAAPLVVWEGSHERIRAAFQHAFADASPSAWPDIDVTEIYQAARRTIFSECARVELPAAPGEAILVHRLALHGVAPWSASARAEPAGRAIAYFRPLHPQGPVAWLADR